MRSTGGLSFTARWTPSATLRSQAAQQLIDRFCGGSVEELLVGLVDNQLLEPKQLQRLAEKIASRKEKKA